MAAVFDLGGSFLRFKGSPKKWPCARHGSGPGRAGSSPRRSRRTAALPGRRHQRWVAQAVSYARRSSSAPCPASRRAFPPLDTQSALPNFFAGASRGPGNAKWWAPAAPGVPLYPCCSTEDVVMRNYDLNPLRRQARGRIDPSSMARYTTRARTSARPAISSRWLNAPSHRIRQR
jgi:hypothetical protein